MFNHNPFGRKLLTVYKIRGCFFQHWREGRRTNDLKLPQGKSFHKPNVPLTQIGPWTELSSAAPILPGLASCQRDLSCMRGG